MNRALWQKAFTDVWVHLLISSLLLAGFSWLFVWLISMFKADLTVALLKSLPKFVERMIGIPIADMVTPLGSISILFIHIVTFLICIGWAVGRGSDSISGEIGRGTMDLLVSLPVWRATLVFVPAVATALGSAVLAASIMLGIGLGLKTVHLRENVALVQFAPGAINLFSMVFCLTGITVLLSSFVRDRWRTIAWAVGFYLISIIIEAVGKVWPGGSWVRYGSFLCAYQPQELILYHGNDLRTQFIYNAVLLGIGVIAYIAGAIVFSMRDVPTSR
jgi:ABC-2 type transport system permease protein